MASSSSSSSSPSFIISNIAHLIPIKLDSTNFLLWKSLFRPVLRSYRLEGFIDGSQSVPPQQITGSDGKSVPNMAYNEWFERDQTLLSWINATLSDSALPYIVSMNTAKEAWDSLERRYASLSHSHVTALKKHLQHVKKGSSTMQDYLHHVKVLSDQLATCGAPVSEDDLIIHTLAGLPPIYRPFQTSIRTHSRHDPVSLEELYTLLVCEDLSLAEDISIESSTAFVSTRNFSPRSSNHGRSSGPPISSMAHPLAPPIGQSMFQGATTSALTTLVQTPVLDPLSHAALPTQEPPGPSLH